MSAQFHRIILIPAPIGPEDCCFGKSEDAPITKAGGSSYKASDKANSASDETSDITPTASDTVGKTVTNISDNKRTVNKMANTCIACPHSDITADAPGVDRSTVSTPSDATSELSSDISRDNQANNDTEGDVVSDKLVEDGTHNDEMKSNFDISDKSTNTENEIDITSDTQHYTPCDTLCVKEAATKCDVMPCEQILENDKKSDDQAFSVLNDEIVNQKCEGERHMPVDEIVDTEGDASSSDKRIDTGDLSSDKRRDTEGDTSSDKRIDAEGDIPNANSANTDDDMPSDKRTDTVDISSDKRRDTEGHTSSDKRIDAEGDIPNTKSTDTGDNTPSDKRTDTVDTSSDKRTNSGDISSDKRTDSGDTSSDKRRDTEGDTSSDKRIDTEGGTSSDKRNAEGDIPNANRTDTIDSTPTDKRTDTVDTSSDKRTDKGEDITEKETRSIGTNTKDDCTSNYRLIIELYRKRMKQNKSGHKLKFLRPELVKAFIQ